ncbi:hypothetical protein B296_00030751 [Ensete ventricosum]|uniref:Uncharacterized protein n=1 Tax=Ensete ventricosum TaxID=4639 RepID=A0A427AIF9_ENSVE|nr:hypothetical protein B296_00030751 [Ensete ventricosum]
MERHDPTLAFTRVLCLWPLYKESFVSPLHIPSSILTSFMWLGHFINFFQVAPAHRFALSLWWPSRPAFHGSAFVEFDLHIDSTCAFVWSCLGSLPHLISQCIHQCITSCEIMRPRCSLDPLSFMELF